MNKNTNYYYIAAPGFNQEQLDVIHHIENELRGSIKDDKSPYILSNDKFNYFSPFTHGGKLKLSDDLEKSKLSVKLLFTENINQLNQATDLIAVVDPADKGTFFEIGYFMSKYNTYHEFLKCLHLYGNHSVSLSSYLMEQYRKYESILKSGLNFYVLDVSTKKIEDYILLGLLFGKGISVITWSNKPMEHNLMTACSTLAHYQWEGLPNSYSSPSKLLLALIEDSNLIEELFDGKLFNLSNLKLNQKIE